MTRISAGSRGMLNFAVLISPEPRSVAEVLNNDFSLIGKSGECPRQQKWKFGSYNLRLTFLTLRAPSPITPPQTSVKNLLRFQFLEVWLEHVDNSI